MHLFLFVIFEKEKKEKMSEFVCVCMYVCMWCFLLFFFFCLFVFSFFFFFFFNLFSFLCCKKKNHYFFFALFGKKSQKIKPVKSFVFHKLKGNEPFQICRLLLLLLLFMCGINILNKYKKWGCLTSKEKGKPCINVMIIYSKCSLFFF